MASKERTRARRARGWARSTSAALAAAGLVAALLPTSVATAQKAERTLWWNDDLIASQLGLNESQRADMDAAYGRYDKRSKEARKVRSIQKAFHDSLEKGDWEKARTQLDEWGESEVLPQHAMSELKLEVLQMLEPAQREKLVEMYPRIIQRQWRPALSWDRGAGGKAFKGARKQQPGGKKGKGGKNASPGGPSADR